MKIIKVDVSKLILADYNPRIKLKPGDRAYEEIKIKSGRWYFKSDCSKFI
jgi:hypothetical protein